MTEYLFIHSMDHFVVFVFCFFATCRLVLGNRTVSDFVSFRSSFLAKLKYLSLLTTLKTRMKKHLVLVLSTRDRIIAFQTWLHQCSVHMTVSRLLIHGLGVTVPDVLALLYTRQISHCHVLSSLRNL